MKKTVFVLVCALAVMLLAACTTVYPGGATGNTIGKKVGEATVQYILGLTIPLKQDAGIATAAANGGISKVSTWDIKFNNYVVFHKLTTVVTGD